MTAQQSRPLSSAEMDELINHGPDYYRKIGSPPIFFANAPVASDAQFSRGNVGGVVYCKKDNDSLGSLQKKIFSVLLGGSRQ